VSSSIGDADRALVTLVPHTTSIRSTEYEAAVVTSFLKPGAFDAQRIVTVPVARAIRLLGTLDATRMHSVELAVCRWLELPCTDRLR
jgi:mRNA interferase MazF